MHCIRGNCAFFAPPGKTRFKNSGFRYYHASRFRYHLHIPPQALVGVDLGTTNSSIAIIGEDGPRVVSDNRGRKSIPSEFEYVSKDADVEADGRETVTTGLRIHDGFERRSSPGKDVFYSCKRIIGLRFEDIASEVKEQLRFTMEGNETGECIMRCQDGNSLTAIDLSAEMTRYLINVALQHMPDGSTVDGAVVAIPAHFSVAQKQATLEAAQNGGVNIVHLLQEPVAAALAYGVEGGTDGETILVFDWGGGTFDVSIIQAFEGIMEILGTDGDQFLGGDDIDELVLQWVLQSYTAALLDSVDTEGLNDACRRAKEELTRSLSTLIRYGDEELCVLDRGMLIEIMGPLWHKLALVLDRIGKHLFVEWSMDPYQAISCLKSSSDHLDRHTAEEAPNSDADPWVAPPRKVTKVVLVGQITRLPMVRKYVQLVTGIQPCDNVDPGEAVALGAATQAGILHGSIGSVELMDGSYSIDLHDRTTGFLTNWQP